ncbi:MAG TPA: YigZ family protein [Acholeplasmataceae bacterium]|nr:YigZ family protein [Acholeplasmataceae bacterium]
MIPTYTIQNPIVYEQIINKSRFICYLFPVDELEKANEILTQIRKKHYDATHNCYSYIIGIETPTAKSSDDGEPSQTAGVPIFEVLKKNNLTNVLAIVTRYYGGIKLGASGLIRAYGSSVAEAVKLAEIVKIEKLTELEITAEYVYVNAIQKVLENHEITERIFTDKVYFKALVPEEEIENIKAELVEVTKGTIEI